MEGKDSDTLFKLNSAPKEDFSEEDQDLLWKKKKKNVLSRWFKMPEDLPYSWLVVGCLLLIVLLFIVFSFTGDDVGEDRFLAMEARLKRIEDRIAKIEDVDEKLTRIWEQAKDFEQFKVRFERQEASLSLRLDNLSKEVDRLQQLKTVAKPAKTEVSKTNKTVDTTAKPKYHTVSQGETLYGISRQYGLTVEKLRQINKLTEGTTIQPGQKLLVKP
jgi:hypothetical protein